MNEEFKSMNDNDFEKLISSALPVPDSNIISDITPFKTAMIKVIVGIALSLLTLNIGFLKLLLPAVGAVILILGLKALRKENKWFYGCFIVSVLQAILILPALITSSTIYSGAFASALSVLTHINIGLDFILLVFFFIGFRDIFRKADLPYKKTYGISIIVWYAVLCFLAFLNYNGLIVPAVMIISFVFILISLYKLSSQLEEAGFVIELTPPKISDKAVALTVSAVLLAGIISGYIFFSQYEMKWEEYALTVSEETDSIKKNLISLGFPEKILEDLKTDEILSLKDAQEIVCESKDHPVNSGREVTDIRNENGTTHYVRHTVYDVKELRITGIAVKLPSERERWKIIQHFEWVENPGFFGTESIQLWTGDKLDGGWYTATEITGQVLYTKDGTDYASPYYSIANESYTSESLLGKRHQSDIFLEFSLPEEAERQRGYVTYEIESDDSGYLIDEWMNYTHQCSPFQYPVMTAKERRMKENWNKSGVFYTVQDAVQFAPTEMK